MFANFESGVGALGGGDVRVRAGRDMKDLSVAIPTTGHLVTPTTPQGQAGLVARAEDLIVRGGGNLAIETGRDLLGGVYMLGRGHAALEAGNRIAAQRRGRSRSGRGSGIMPWWGPEATNVPVNMLIGLMDATASLNAVGDIAIEGIYDPMLTGQVAGNLNSNGRGSAFVSYSDRTAVEAVSASGTVAYLGNPWRAPDLSLGGSYEVKLRGSPKTIRGRRFSPGSTCCHRRCGWLRFSPTSRSRSKAATFGIYDPMLLAPGHRERWSFWPATTFCSARDSEIRLDDIAPQYRRGPLAPFGTDRNSFLFLGVGDALPQPIGANSNWERGFTLLHAADPEPVRLYALNGSIGSITGWSLTAPKPVDVYAGEDILYGTIAAQNNDTSQVSSVIAGRDIVSPKIAFLGQGALWVEAGRNLTFVASEGIPGRGSIMSLGNVLPHKDRINNSGGFSETRDDTDIPNLALADKGGDINIIAGTAGGADYAGFAALYLDPAKASDRTLPLSHPDNAGKVVRTYEKELADFLEGARLRRAAGRRAARSVRLPSQVDAAGLPAASAAHGAEGDWHRL